VWVHRTRVSWHNLNSVLRWVSRLRCLVLFEKLPLSVEQLICHVLYSLNLSLCGLGWFSKRMLWSAFFADHLVDVLGLDLFLCFNYGLNAFLLKNSEANFKELDFPLKRLNKFRVLKDRSVDLLFGIRLCWLGNEPVVEGCEDALLVLSGGSVTLLKSLSQVILYHSRDLEEADLHTCCMLEVFFSCLRNFLAQVISCKRFHTRT